MEVGRRVVHGGVLALLLVASTAAAAEGRGCVADRYAAVFVPWSDQASKPRVWVIPEAGPVEVVDLNTPEIRGVVCTPDAVLLRVPDGVVSVTPGTATPRHLTADPWTPSRSERRRSFTLRKERILRFGRHQRQLLIAKAKGGSEAEPQVFTAVLVADAGPAHADPALLFSTNMMTVTVD